MPSPTVGDDPPVDLELPLAQVRVDRGAGPCRNTDRCRQYERQMHEVLVGRYIAQGQPFAGQIVAARINLCGLSEQEYLAQVRKQYKGNAVRDARKADRAGLVCRMFTASQWISDIVRINHSKDERCGRPMGEAYQRSVQQMQSDAQQALEFQPLDCPCHYDLWWGIFAGPDGGLDVLRTDEQLLGYIRLRRNGNYMLYAQFLGHGDYLRYGIMYRLHLAIIAWLCQGQAEPTLGLDHLIYAGFRQGGRGLQLWKKKMCFEPAYLVLAAETPVVAADSRPDRGGA